MEIVSKFQVSSIPFPVKWTKEKEESTINEEIIYNENFNYSDYLSGHSLEYDDMSSLPFDKLNTKDPLEKTYKIKEQEWIKLVGNDFLSLDGKSKEFLIKTAGVIDFGFKIDIKKTYHYSIYNEGES